MANKTLISSVLILSLSLVAGFETGEEFFSCVQKCRQMCNNAKADGKLCDDSSCAINFCYPDTTVTVYKLQNFLLAQNLIETEASETTTETITEPVTQKDPKNHAEHPFHEYCGDQTSELIDTSMLPQGHPTKGGKNQNHVKRDRNKSGWGLTVLQFSLLLSVVVFAAKYYVDKKRITKKVKYTFEEGESQVPYSRLIKTI